jgi:hypothetical protein
VGGKEGFRAIAVSQKVRIRQKSDGNAELILKDVQEPVDAGTDLFLPFDSPILRDESEHWNVQSGNVQFVESHQARGKGSGAFFSDSYPYHNTHEGFIFFFRPNRRGIPMNYWLYPRIGKGEVFSSGEKRGTSRAVIRNKLQDHKAVLVWSFLNFFSGPGGSKIDVSLWEVLLLSLGNGGITLFGTKHHGYYRVAVWTRTDAVVYRYPQRREDGSVYYPALERGGQSPPYRGRLQWVPR